MKKLLVVLVLPLFVSAQSPSAKIKVLFLGNSYTYVNNLPQLIYNVALSKGDTLIYDSNCIGGYSFYNHTVDAASLAKISAGNWDYVVLQAQSQEPSFPPMQVNAQTLPYAIQLDTLIKYYNACAHTVFYETWGRKYGDQPNCAAYPPLCTYAGMQNRLRDSYRMFADTVHGLMAPVGEAWRLAIASNTLMDLYQADQSHPSLEGSYLAAAVLYETLFQKSVLTSTFNPGIGSATVSLLNQSAHQLVTDSAAITNIPKYLPKASFTLTQNGASYQFLSGTPGLGHHWNFGDGSSSSSPTTSHTYMASGIYTVSLVVYNTLGCKIDSVSTTVQVQVLTAMDEHVTDAVLMYPNPCNSNLTIKADSRFKTSGSLMEVRNVMGQLLYSGVFTENLNTSGLENGLYYLKIYNAQARVNTCFIKNE